MYYRDYREIYEWAFTAKIYPNKKEVGETVLLADEQKPAIQDKATKCLRSIDKV